MSGSWWCVWGHSQPTGDECLWMKAQPLVLQVGSSGRHCVFISGAPRRWNPFGQQLEPQLWGPLFGLFLVACLTFLGSSFPSVTWDCLQNKLPTPILFQAQLSGEPKQGSQATKPWKMGTNNLGSYWTFLWTVSEEVVDFSPFCWYLLYISVKWYGELWCLVGSGLELLILGWLVQRNKEHLVKNPWFPGDHHIWGSLDTLYSLL